MSAGAFARCGLGARRLRGACRSPLLSRCPLQRAAPSCVAPARAAVSRVAPDPTARRRLAVAAACLLVASGCGKKGPPLPPLVRMPVAPAELKAERRGSTVDIQLIVPAQNTDGSRPANVERVEVYGWTGPTEVSAAEVVSRGTRVGTVAVKAPRDPNRTVRAGEPLDDIEPLQGSGLDQGATARLQEVLREDTAPADPATAADSASATRRAYVALAITTRGKRGPSSSPSLIPLGPAPDAPRDPAVSYDETGVTVRWTGSPLAEGSSPAAPGADAVTAGYHVYDVSAPGAAPSGSSGADASAGQRLTTSPEAGTTFLDRRVEWGRERCYAVRQVRTVGSLAVEGDASPPTCVTPVDTFPPAPPTGLTAVASQGAINLIWNANGEKDFAGYHVLRSDGPGGPFKALTSSPITATTFSDQVKGGTRYAYAVQAVDQAGNTSAQSPAVEEAAQDR